MFVRNAWYVGAWSDELSAGGKVARTLLGEPVLFFRGEDGQLAALQDRCCHRALPLSFGTVVGNQIQCGYHGLVFDGCGQCVKVPGQDRIPPAAKVRSYPVVERDAMVWIWMGEPERADESLIVSHPWHSDPGWDWVKDRYLIEANYQLITDNLMDLTHVGYVHTRTIGGTPQAHSEAITQTTSDERSVRVERHMPNSVPPPAYTMAHTFGTERVDRWMEIEFQAPSVVRIHTGAVNTGTGAYEGRREGGIRFWGLNAQTPETENTTHYFWTGARNRSADEPPQAKRLLDSLSVTFAEDKVVVEAQQKSLERQPEPMVMITTDAGVVRARRIVSAMLESEAP